MHHLDQNESDPLLPLHDLQVERLLRKEKANAAVQAVVLRPTVRIHNW